jgi:hypothetical protein
LVGNSVDKTVGNLVVLKAVDWADLWAVVMVEKTVEMMVEMMAVKKVGMLVEKKVE